MKPIIMFERTHRGGIVTALYTPKSKSPFNFMFSKGEKYKACLPCETLVECWDWVDKVRLDNDNQL